MRDGITRYYPSEDPAYFASNQLRLKLTTQEDIELNFSRITITCQLHRQSPGTRWSTQGELSIDEGNGTTTVWGTPDFPTDVESTTTTGFQDMWSVTKDVYHEVNGDKTITFKIDTYGDESYFRMYAAGGAQLTKIETPQSYEIVLPHIDIGAAYIDNGSALEKYLIYVDNGSSWDQCIAYVDNGSSWDQCG